MTDNSEPAPLANAHLIAAHKFDNGNCTCGTPFHECQFAPYAAALEDAEQRIVQLQEVATPAEPVTDATDRNAPHPQGGGYFASLDPRVERPERVQLCGAVNPHYPDEYTCTYPAGHGRINEPDQDVIEMDHGAPEGGAFWGVTAGAGIPDWKITTSDIPDDGVTEGLVDRAGRAMYPYWDVHMGAGPKGTPRPGADLMRDQVRAGLRAALANGGWQRIHAAAADATDVEYGLAHNIPNYGVNFLPARQMSLSDAEYYMKKDPAGLVVVYRTPAKPAGLWEELSND